MSADEEKGWCDTTQMRHERLRRIGQMLHAGRESKGWTLKQVATALQQNNYTKTNEAQIRRIERGAFDTAATVLITFACLVEVPFDDLAEVICPAIVGGHEPDGAL